VPAASIVFIAGLRAGLDAAGMALPP